ncbi:MAG: hypothetical protein WCP34_08850, partial [Pseudomonadota bacterium]
HRTQSSRINIARLYAGGHMLRTIKKSGSISPQVPVQWAALSIELFKVFSVFVVTGTESLSRFSTGWKV